jgi:hypothetical protein
MTRMVSHPKKEAAASPMHICMHACVVGQCDISMLATTPGMHVVSVKGSTLSSCCLCAARSITVIGMGTVHCHMHAHQCTLFRASHMSYDPPAQYACIHALLWGCMAGMFWHSNTWSSRQPHAYVACHRPCHHSLIRACNHFSSSWHVGAIHALMNS